LTQDLDTIWGNFKKNRRKGIRRALCSALTVRDGSWDDLESFYDLLIALMQRRKGKSYPISYFRHTWRVLHPHGYLRLFVLERRGEPVSMHWVIPFGKTLVSKLAVWSGDHPELHPNELLEWWVIQWAKAQGYQCYDFEGVDLRAAQALLASQPVPAKLEQTATSFKLSFGGTPMIFPSAIERFSNPILHYLYTNFLHPWLDSSFLKQMLNRVRTYGGDNAGHKRVNQS
jgi:hypothetical protein